jgi:Uma2 family endonuclease
MVTVSAPPVTLEQFSHVPRNGEKHEVSEGELLTMPPAKLLHTLIAQRLQELLQAHLTKQRKARALMEAGYVLSRDPLTIRQPDVSILSNDRIRATTPDDYCEGAPELAIEVVSPSDAAEDLELKARQYLLSGGKEVWIIYPKTRTVHMLRTGSVQIFGENDMLESPELLPGFSVNVADLFRLDSAVQ